LAETADQHPKATRYDVKNLDLPYTKKPRMAKGRPNEESKTKPMKCKEVDGPAKCCEKETNRKNLS